VVGQLRSVDPAVGIGDNRCPYCGARQQREHLLVRCHSSGEKLKTPDVHLNHLYVHVDVTAQNAIAESEFMRNEFANMEVSTIEAGDDRAWTGIYLTGANTYIEFFSPSRAPSSLEQVGDSGVALSVEEVGGIERVAKCLGSMGRPRAPSLFERKVDGDPIPWFWNLPLVEYPEGEAEPFCSWVMEVDRDFLTKSRGSLWSGGEGISRHQYNAAKFQATRYMKDIDEVTVALNEFEAASFGRQLVALGYISETCGGVRTLIGPDITFRLIEPSPTARGVTQLKMSLLKEKVGSEILTFGQGVTLSFDSGQTAIMSFSIIS
jgi:hypothetical protein